MTADRGRRRALMTAALVVVVGAVLVSFPIWLPPYYLTTVIRILFYSMLAMSLSFLAGQGGMVSLTQTGLFGFSAYVLAILSVHYGLTFPFPLLIALTGTMGLAFVVGIISIRTYGTYFLILTLALGQMLWAIAQQWTSVTEGFDGIQGTRPPVIGGLSFQVPANFYWVLLVVFLACFVLLRAVIRSPFGLAMRGMRDSHVRMSALGYSVPRIRLTAFMIAAVPAALAGTFFVQFTGIITPVTLDLDRTVWILLIVILGGVGSLGGTVVGVFIALMFEVAVTRFTDRYLTAMGITFLLLVLFAPNGLAGALESLQRRVKRGRRRGSDQRASGGIPRSDPGSEVRTPRRQ